MRSLKRGNGWTTGLRPPPTITIIFFCLFPAGPFTSAIAPLTGSRSTDGFVVELLGLALVFHRIEADFLSIRRTLLPSESRKDLERLTFFGAEGGGGGGTLGGC